jgi:hypothetical protein
MTDQIRPEIADHPLARASREVNEYCEKHGLPETCALVGLKFDDLLYMARQRALRSLFATYGRNFNPKKPTSIQLSPSEERLLLALTMSCMDGLVIGWRAQQQHTKEAE